MTKAEKTRLLKANIEFFLAMTGYSKEQLAFKIGISLASYYNKMKDIDSFTFHEIIKLFSIIGLDNETKLQLMS